MLKIGTLSDKIENALLELIVRWCTSLLFIANFILSLNYGENTESKKVIRGHHYRANARYFYVYCG